LIRIDTTLKLTLPQADDHPLSQQKPDKTGQDVPDKTGLQKLFLPAYQTDPRLPVQNN
jgi:hypothetical protein